MIRHAAGLAVFAILFTACKQQDNSAQEKMILAGMQSANEVIHQTNLSLGHNLEQLRYDPDHFDRMKTWMPRLEKLNRSTLELLNHIDDLSRKLDENDSPGKIIQSEKAGHILFLQLYYFKRNLIGMVTPADFAHPREADEKKALFTEMPLLPFFHEISDKIPDPSYEEKWIDSSFSNCTPVICQVMLCKIKNDVLISGQRMMQFLHRKIYHPSCKILLPVISLSSSCVRSGEPITVSGGLGEFIVPLNQWITIDGKTIQSEGSFVEYQLKTARKPGKYSFPVRFGYTKYDGTREEMVKTFSYTVVQ